MNGLVITIAAVTARDTKIAPPEFIQSIYSFLFLSFVPISAPNARSALGRVELNTDATEAKISGAPFPNAMNVTP